MRRTHDRRGGLSAPCAGIASASPAPVTVGRAKCASRKSDRDMAKQDQDWDSYPRSHYPCKFYNREVISNDSKSTSSDRSTESNALHKLLRREHPAALDDVAHGDVLNICDILTSGGLDEI